MLREIIQPDVVCVEPDARVTDVARLMSERDVGSVLVLTNDRPRGIITDRDLVVRCLAENLDPGDTTIENIMTESVESCFETDGIFDCIEKMRKTRVRRMPVVDEQGKAVGIVSFGDILAILTKELHALIETTTPLEEISEEPRDMREAA